MDQKASSEGAFPPTLWNVVLTARGGSDGDRSEALERLFRIYWKPLNTYVRHWCRDPHQADDLTQGFCCHLLKKGRFLENVGPEKGRFRSFLLAALKNYLRDEWAKGKTARRGGKTEFISIDAVNEEGQPLVDLPEDRNSVSAFDRAWAEALMEQVFTRLKESLRETGKLAQFELLQPCLLGQSPLSYSEIGEKLGKTEGAVKQDVRRLKVEFQRIFREEIRQTLADSDSFEDELRHLMSVLASR